MRFRSASIGPGLAPKTLICGVVVTRGILDCRPQELLVRQKLKNHVRQLHVITSGYSVHEWITGFQWLSDLMHVFFSLLRDLLQSFLRQWDHLSLHAFSRRSTTMSTSRFNTKCSIQALVTKPTKKPIASPIVKVISFSPVLSLQASPSNPSLRCRAK